MLVLILAIGAFATAFVLMTLLWAVQFRTHKAAIVDVGWPSAIVLIGVLYYVLTGAPGDGDPTRRLLMLVMGAGWGLRLAGYVLFTRVVGVKEEVDGRYTQLKQEWKENLQLRLYIFFQFQAGLAAIFSLPLLLLAINPAPALNPVEWVGAAIWLVGVLGEATADLQLHGFKKNPANRGKLCNVGLWNYSRHPNYFFEWLVWVGFFVTALPSPGGWSALICPALMLFFLFKVTGIPANEEQNLRSRGDAYREYQRTTSAFVPWFKKV
jgi:steroid 5-alpha reductase family enzyme